MSLLAPCHVWLKPGQSGDARIVQDRPSKFDIMRAAMQRMHLEDRIHSRLLIGNETWMTDAAFEAQTNHEFVRRATGQVLIAGLGLGFIIKPIIEKVESVTVIEKNPDVIKLVSRQIGSKKVSVVHADAYEYRPEKASFDTIYFDIWPNVPNSDDWENIKLLKRRYRRGLKVGGWMGAWCEKRARRS